jgi:2-iminobutanoate/2-iminopropanoate deaminase
MDNETRRSFIGKVSVVAPVAAIGAGSAAAFGSESPGKREVTAARPGAPFSRAVSFGGIVHVAGVVGRPVGVEDVGSVSFDTQCRLAMENLKASVEASGSSMKHVMQCTCFLTEVSDFPMFNKIYRGYFPTDPPARSTVVVKELVVKGAKIEIDCVTCLG